MNKLFSEENKVPRTLLEAWKVAGSATYKCARSEVKISQCRSFSSSPKLESALLNLSVNMRRIFQTSEQPTITQLSAISLKSGLFHLVSPPCSFLPPSLLLSNLFPPPSPASSPPSGMACHVKPMIRIIRLIKSISLRLSSTASVSVCACPLPLLLLPTLRTRLHTWQWLTVESPFKHK